MIVEMAVMAGMPVGLHWAHMLILWDCLHTAGKPLHSDVTLTSNLVKILLATLYVCMQL